MNRNYRTAVFVVGITIASLLVPEVAVAYGGPGSIVSGIGALLAALAAIGAAIFGFVWFPAKKFYRKIRGDVERADTEQMGEAVSD